MPPKDTPRRLRFRILAADGIPLGWITRESEEEAEKALAKMFPRGGIRVEFPEEDQ